MSKQIRWLGPGPWIAGAFIVWPVAIGTMRANMSAGGDVPVVAQEFATALNPPQGHVTAGARHEAPRLAAAGTGLAVTQSPPSNLDTAPRATARFAQDLVAAAYPELLASRLSFVLEEYGSDIRLTAREVLDPFQLDSSIALRSVVSARIAFDTDGRWRSFDAEGPWLRSDDYTALRDRVRRQPFQSASESQAWLAARGAQHGPDRAVPVAQRLRRADWSRLLQANVIIQPVGFRWTDLPTAVGNGDVMPGWVAVLSLSRQPGAFETYEVLFEPFNGRIVRIRRE